MMPTVTRGLVLVLLVLLVVGEGICGLEEVDVGATGTVSSEPPIPGLKVEFVEFVDASPEVMVGGESSLPSWAVERGTPVVLRDHHVSEWAAFKKWHGVELARVLAGGKEGKIDVKHQEGRPVYTLVDSNETRWGDLAEDPTYETRGVRSREFVSALEKKTTVWDEDFDPASQTYRYVIVTPDDAQVQELEPRGIVEVHEVEEAIAKSRRAKGEPEEEATDIENMSRGVLWGGEAGVVAQTHYDSSHNFYTQILGNKTFYLFAPSGWYSLHLFPNSHPSRRQCQTSSPALLDAALPTGGPEFLPLNVTNGTILYQADLQPGDVLYIPPYWFHSVLATTGSLSYSVLSPSLEEYHYSRVRRIEVPWHLFKGKRERVMLARLLIIQVVETLGFDSSDFIAHLLRSRWAPLANKLRPNSSLSKSFNCVKGYRAARKRVAEVMEKPLINLVAQVNLVLESDLYSDNTRIILLQDFVDRVVTEAVGPANALLLLEKCFV